VDAQRTYTLVFVFTTFPPEVSGSALFNWERVQWLAQQGTYQIVVLANNWQDSSSLPCVPPGLERNLIIETFPSKPWLIYELLQVPTFAAVRQIEERLAFYQPNLITLVDIERMFWFSTWHLPGRDYARQHRIPYITEYQTDYYNHIGTYPCGKLLREILLKPVQRYLYHQCDITLAISPASARSLQQIGISNFHSLSFHGVDIAPFSPSYRDRKWLETCLTPEEQNHQVILFLGRLALEKRIDLLIEAFAKLKRRLPKCSLVIAGEGPTNVMTKLKRLAQPIPHIHFVGFAPEEKAKLLASCDIYCTPAPYETFGRTPVEAMASGIPVVTVNSGGVSDYVVDRVNGYLVPPENVEALTNMLETVLSTNNETLIERALQDAKKLSIERACQMLNDYYQNLLISICFESYNFLPIQ
jgi:glycosyltransferase involved in cell wall biosynthesis